jgi:hypothetical protein
VEEAAVDGSRFDALTVALTGRLSRRALGRRAAGAVGLAGLTAGLVGRGRVDAQDRPRAPLPNGAKCTSDSDCQSTYCGPGARGRRVCASCTVAPTIGSVPNVQNDGNNGSGWQIPEGLSQKCTTGPDTLTDSPTCPVIQFCDWTWWVYSYADNRTSFGLVAYERETGAIASQLEAEGARYVWAAEVNAGNETVVLTGQGNDQAITTWDELRPTA